MPTKNLKKLNLGFAHPILLLVASLILVTVIFFAFKTYKERPLQYSTGATEETVAGVTAPTGQIAAIPKAECDFFVSTTGNDSNSGTSENSPLRKIQTGVNKLQSPGHVLCIKGGVYREAVKIGGKNGTANNLIKMGGYVGGGLPIVSGGIVNGDEYMLPDPQCKVKDVCTGDQGPSGRCKERDKCMYQFLFTVGDSSHFHIYGIDVRGSSGRGILVSNSNYVYVKGVRSYHHWNSGFNIGSTVASKGIQNNFEYIAVFDNLRALPENGQIGGGGVHVNVVQSGSIKNSLVFENFGEGLDVQKGAKDFVVEDSMFWDNYHAFLYANGSINATFNSNLLFCTKNRVTWLEQNNVKPGANTGYGAAITIRNEQGVTSQHGEGGGTMATNNLVLGCTNGIIIAPQGSANLADVWVLNNTVVSPRSFPAGGKYEGKSGEGISISGAGSLTNINIENNLVFADSSGGSITGGRMTDGAVKYKNNIVSKAPSQARPGITVTDPKFSKGVGVSEVLNPENLDARQYYINSGSPAINAGTKLTNHRGTQDKDFYDNNRGTNPIDVGAYEAGQPRNWTNLYKVVMAGSTIVDDDGGDDPEPPEPPVDTDGDGVIDSEDKCPNIHQGNTPDPARRGCPLEEDDDDEPEEPTTTTNVIRNPGFTLPATPNTNEFAKFWTFKHGRLGKSNISVIDAGTNTLAVGNMARLTIVKNPITAYPSINQRGVTMKPNTSYRISFVAKTTKPATLVMSFREMGYVQEYLAPTVRFNLGTSWKAYEAEIKTKTYNPEKAVSVMLGYKAPDGSSLLIDRVRVEEKIQ